jgi:hypothetical protein
VSDKSLLKLQAGKETTWGTAVVDTVRRMLIDDVKFTPIAQTKRFQEMRGSMAPAYVAALQKLAGQFMYKGAVSYDDAPYEFDAVFGTVAPTGAGPYVYAYAGPLTAVVASPRKQTLFFGDSVEGIYKMPGSVVEKLHYSIKNADSLMFDASGIGLIPVSGASFASLSDRTVTPIMAGDFTVYLDTWGGTIGTTALAADVYSLDLTLETKRDLRFYLGNLAPGRFREPQQWDFTLKLVLEFISATPNTKAQLDAILALASGSVYQKQVRLKATTGANAIWQVDLAGTNEKAPELWSYENGVQTLELELKGQYNSTLTNWIAASVTNQVSTMA